MEPCTASFVGKPMTAHTRASITRAAEVVRTGGVLLYPTATVIGIGGDAGRPDIAARIRQLKGRGGAPFLALTDEWSRVRPWLADLDPLHEALLELTEADPRALTLLLQAGHEAPFHLVGEEGWVGVRRTRHPFCRALVKAADRPILSTSANRSGEPPTSRVADLHPDLARSVDYGVEADAADEPPSTLVAVVDGELDVRREGALPARELTDLLTPRR